MRWAIALLIMYRTTIHFSTALTVIVMTFTSSSYGQARPADPSRRRVPGLIAALSDPRDDVRHSAIDKIARTGEPASGAAPELIELLANEDSDIRRSTAHALGCIGAEDAVPELVKLLGDQDSDVRHSTVDALAVIGESAKAAVPEPYGCKRRLKGAAFRSENKGHFPC